MLVVEFLMIRQRYQGRLSLRVVGIKSVASSLHYLQLHASEWAHINKTPLQEIIQA